MNHYPRMISCTVLVLVALAMASQAHAQFGRRENADRAQEASQLKRDSQKTQPQEAEKFPNATRKSPELQPTQKGGEKLNEIVGLYQAKNYPQTIQEADAYAATTDNAYEKSFAYQLAATAAADSGDNAEARDYFQKAIDANGLNNNAHYQTMYNLAVTQYQTGQNDAALATLNRLTAETKADLPEYARLRAGLLAQSGKGADAAPMFEQQYRQNPDDSAALNNAVALYQQANQFDKAGALLADAQAKGKLNDPKLYRALYVNQINQDKLQDALATIEAGSGKGLVPADADLANAYSVIGQKAYEKGDTAMAEDMFKRAAPLAKDGEPGLNLAKLLMNDGHKAEAATAAQAALAKGLQHPEQAQKIIQAGK